MYPYSSQWNNTRIIHTYIQVYCVHLFSPDEVKWETGVHGGWCLFNICCYSWGCCYRNNQVNGQEQEGNQRDVPICVILLKLNFSGGLGVFGEFAPYITRFYHLSIRPMNATSWGEHWNFVIKLNRATFYNFSAFAAD